MQPPEVSLEYMNGYLVNGKPNYDLNLKDDWAYLKICKTMIYDNE